MSKSFVKPYIYFSVILSEIVCSLINYWLCKFLNVKSMNTVGFNFAICLVPATAFLIWLFTPWGKKWSEGIVVMKKIKYILCACLMMASMGMKPSR